MPWILLLLSSPIVRADVAPEAPSGEQFTTYGVRVEGLAAFPDVVLVLHDRGNPSTIHGYRAFSADSPEHVLASGAASRGNVFSQPDLFAMSRAEYDAWSAQTAAEIARQEEACSERGEGCPHISRFVPRFAPPTGTVACGASIAITTTAPTGGPDAHVDVFSVTTASASTCTLSGPARVSLREGKPISTSSRCDALNLSGSLLALGLALLAVLPRRG